MSWVWCVTLPVQDNHFFGIPQSKFISYRENIRMAFCGKSLHEKSKIIIFSVEDNNIDTSV
jgi:hypothetical protein